MALLAFKTKRNHVDNAWSRTDVMPLDQVGEGVFCCRNVAGEDESAKRLKRLGICEGREVEVLSSGDPMFVFVAGAQIGLSRALAKLVTVEIAS